MVKKIEKNEFDAFVMLSKHPRLSDFVKELEYFTNDEHTALGVIVLDKTDNNFSSVVLKRNKDKRFVATDTEIDFQTIDEAEIWITNKLNKNSSKNREVNTENKVYKKRKNGVDLFDVVIGETKLHPYFKRLNEDTSFFPAKQIISEISNHFTDIDGNFVNEFQSINGFDSRLFELYLFCFLKEEGFLLDRSKNSPDFMLEKDGQCIALEAVTVNRNKNNPPKYFEKLSENTKVDIISKTNNDMPLRYASALTSKLNKEYWKLDHVKNKPLILAIADFHDTMAMTWSSTALTNYLYGLKYTHKYDQEGKLIIEAQEINNYKKSSGADVKAGFFSLPGAENISAVLFSPIATISKFNRLGTQAGFLQKGTTMLRFVSYYNHDDPNASIPKFKCIEVNKDSEETWAEGANLFHNPFAKHPIDDILFQSITTHRLEGNQIVSQIPKFHPYNSITQIIESK